MLYDDLFGPLPAGARIIQNEPHKRVFAKDLGDKIAIMTQTRVDPIIDDNTERRNASAGERWGDGQIVASIPMDLYWRKIMPARLNGDDAYIRRFLNDSDNSKLRTFGGTV